MRTAAETFGISGAALAASEVADPQVMGPGNGPTYATTRVQNEPPSNPVAALLDPSHSAIFWIGLAAILGLVMVTGQFRVQAALGGRAGRR